MSEVYERTRKGLYRCLECGKTIRPAQVRDAPCRYGHPFVCHHCPRRFSTAIGRGTHMRLAHPTGM